MEKPNKPAPENLSTIPEPTVSNDMAALFDKAANFLSSAIDKQHETQVRVAEINKPIYEANIELEKDKIAKQHENWNKVTDAHIAKDKREFRLGASVALIVLLFLVASSTVLLLRGEYQTAFPIITLIVGLIGGFSTGAQWQKGHQQKSNTNISSNTN